MPGKWVASRFLSLSYNRVRYVNAVQTLRTRNFSVGTINAAEITPLRKKLKDAARANRPAPTASVNYEVVSEKSAAEWELTVGIEIHAQLNTNVKLFSCMYAVRKFRIKD